MLSLELVKIIYEQKGVAKTLLGFFLLLTQLALTPSHLTSICFTVKSKLGSRGWVLTVQFYFMSLKYVPNS